MKKILLSIHYLIALGILSAKPIAPPEFDTPDKRLYFFVCNGDIEGIDAALEEGADINAVEKNSYPPLHISIFQENQEVFDHLLKKGADIHLFSDFGNCNALSLATIYYRREMVLKLLDTGADPNATVEAPYMKEYSAIAYAALYGHVDLLKLFADRGGDLEKPLRWPMWRELPNEFPLLSLAAQHGGLEVVRYLVEERGHVINPPQKIPVLSPLSVAVRYNNIEVAKYLISMGADVNAVGHDYYKKGSPTQFVSSFLSPLGVAGRYGRHEMVRLLFAHGAKVRENVKESENPLYLADWAGYYRVIEEFEKHGYSFDYWAVLEREFQAERSRDEKAAPIESASEFTPTFLKGHSRQWEVADEVDLGKPLRLAIIADEKSVEVADLLTVALSGKTYLELIERSELDEVLREQKLSRAGLTNGKNLSLISGLLDAQALILIETLTVSKKQVYQLRLVNSILGLQFGRHFVENDDAVIDASLEQYAGSVGALTNNFRRNYEKAIPLSLVNVRSDLGTVEGLKVENSLKQLLELQFLGQPSVLLTQREDLETLIREKDLGGREEEFKASSLFVDVGVELDATGEKASSYTVRVETASGEIFTLELAADGKPLDEAAAITRNVMDWIKVDYAEARSVQEGALIKDSEAYFNEAMWYFNLEDYESCIERMRTSISLGYNKRAVWDYYFRAVELLIEELRDHRGNDANNRIVLALERERLIALEGLLKLYRSDVTREDLHFPQFGIEGFERQNLAGLNKTFERFRSVALQRRYTEQLMGIERQFLYLIQEYIAPCYAEPRKHERYPLSGESQKELLQVVDLMAQLDEPEYQKALDVLMGAFAERGSPEKLGRVIWWNIQSCDAPVADHRWFSAALKYVEDRAIFSQSLKRLYVSYYGKFDYHTAPAVPISVLDRKKLASQIRQSVDVSQADDEIDALRRMILYEGLFGGLGGNFFEGAISLRPQKYSEEQEIRLVQYDLIRDVPGASGPAKNFKYLKPVSMVLEALEAAYADGRLRKSKLNEKKIREFKERRDYLAGGISEEEEIKISELKIRLWNPEKYGVPEFILGSRLLHAPIRGDGSWYALAAVNRGSGSRLENPRYAMLQIDPETLQTRALWFETAPVEKVSYFEATKNGQWLAIASIGHPIVLINTDTLQVKTLSEFVPAVTDRFTGRMCVIGEWFFFMVQPSREEGGNWAQKPKMQMMVRYDPKTDDREVVYNTRRNPPETPVDGSGSVFRFKIDSTPGAEVMFIRQNPYSPSYRIDVKTLEIRKASGEEAQRAELYEPDMFSRSVLLEGENWKNPDSHPFYIDELKGLEASMICFSGKNSRKNITPTPSDEDILIADYNRMKFDHSDGRYEEFPPQVFARLNLDGMGHGYVNLTQFTGSPKKLIYGIFKMSDLADALEASTNLKDL